MGWEGEDGGDVEGGRGMIHPSGWETRVMVVAKAKNWRWTVRARNKGEVAAALLAPKASLQCGGRETGPPPPGPPAYKRNCLWGFHGPLASGTEGAGALGL